MLREEGGTKRLRDDATAAALLGLRDDTDDRTADDDEDDATEVIDIRDPVSTKSSTICESVGACLDDDVATGGGSKDIDDERADCARR